MSVAGDQADGDASGLKESKKTVRSIQELNAAGGLMKEAAPKVIEKQRMWIEECYSGRGVKAVKNTLQDEKALFCITGKMKKWLFPAPFNEKEAGVTMTIFFRT